MYRNIRTHTHTLTHTLTHTHTHAHTHTHTRTRTRTHAHADCFIMQHLVSHLLFRPILAGTSNLVEACIKHGVKRLIYTSTIDVVIGYDDIRNGNEQLPVPKCLLFPGYPETKHRAEQLVLQAHGRKLMTAGNNLVVHKKNSFLNNSF